ncbi:receptor-like protein EIX2 [Cornus florida]|uniref:receptor-like protein EIX2 n=1 Tax=Cornus florida TaxID=4283 RepID=UPI002898D06E|nr:receptor-like protein EIX2 [Cornus florida]
MANSNSFLGLVVRLFLLVVLLGSSSYLEINIIKLTSAKCIEEERKALLTFKQGLKDPSGRLSSWVGDACCHWSGVRCNNVSGHVVKLHLRNPFSESSEIFWSMEYDYERFAYASHYQRSCLRGQISSSLLHLKYLNYLDLSFNDFEGTRIPKFLGMFENLRYLNLSSSFFAGEIPPHLGNLSSLNSLDLGYDLTLFHLIDNPVGMSNLLTPNLEWLTRLSSLKYLNMREMLVNDINWLQSINMLPNLLELHLPRCSLQSLPLSLPFINLTFLSVIDISENQFFSSIPNWLFNLTTLTELDLRGSNFNGTIPSKFVNLKFLKSLDISVNDFNCSSIPNWLSNLTSLTRLRLSGNSFNGTIPSEFVNLKSLESLDLSGNGFEGQIPIVLGNLCKLKILDLSENQFSEGVVEFFGALISGCPTNSIVSLSLRGNYLVGELPDSIGILENLQNLYLSGNFFWGSIPKSIGNLSNLQKLDISSNQMNGTIPESFGQLSKLIDLNLNWNSWEGVIITDAHLINLTGLKYFQIDTYKFRSVIFNVTYEWIPPFKLKHLDLKNCLVGPRFPMWLQLQSELSYLSLTNVGIADTIPGEWFSKLSSRVTYLDLSSNQIKGTLPIHLEYPKLGSMDLSNNHFEGPLPSWSTNASVLSLNNNSFSGPIPSNIGELMPQLQVLHLFQNPLGGTIPLSLCKMEMLKSLVLRTNQLSGELPQCWKASQTLSIMDMANNKLSGEIPSSLGSLSSLQELMLSNNMLHGKIPPSLQNCMLVMIDLGGNNLTGKLPLWIGERAPALQILLLRSNSFSGVIPQRWCNLTELHILDLADNNLSGVIPSCLGNLTALIYGNSSFFYLTTEQIVVVAKGRELTYGKTMEYVNIIDLSANSLIGEIPEEITSLIALGTLNLSMNHLSGWIPDNVGNLQYLETLDVSNNNLSGPIPQSLSSLTFLAHLNMSHNNLAGKIPSGNQLQTLDDSSIYEGNPLLCGLPLPTKCPGDDKSDVPPRDGGHLDDSDDENGLDMAWFYISLGPGFVVGFWVVFGTILIKKSWRHCYFQFLENMIERIVLSIALRVANLRRRWAQ